MNLQIKPKVLVKYSNYFLIYSWKVIVWAKIMLRSEIDVD